MPPGKILAASLEVFVIFVAVSLIHRLADFDALAGGTLKLATVDGLKALAIGLLSDVWISYLGALVALLACGSLTFLGYPSIGRLFRVLLLIGLGAVMELSYASGGPAGAAGMAGPSLGIIAALIVIGILVLAFDPFGRLKAGKLAAAFIGLSLAGLAAHHENIQLRPTVPEPLKVNKLERLYMDAGW